MWVNLSNEKFPRHRLTGLFRSGSAITQVVAQALSRLPPGAKKAVPGGRWLFAATAGAGSVAVDSLPRSLPPSLEALAFVQVDRLVLERVLQTADALALEVVYEDLKNLFSTVDELDAADPDGEW